MKRWMTAVLVLAAASAAAAEREEYLTYEQFISRVEAGVVVSVTLDDFSSITGKRVTESGTNAFQTYAKTGSANDPLLARFLEEHDVAVSMRDVEGPSPTLPAITGLMFLAVPIATLALLIVILVKINRLLSLQRGEGREA